MVDSDAEQSSPRIGILTVSDRASRGEYEDRSGPAMEEALREYLVTDCRYEFRIVSDDVEAIQDGIRGFADEGCSLICTTGGTGPAPRDVTPEATAAVCEKVLPGFGEAMRLASVKAGVPTAILSRQAAGIVGKSLVINFPGKPKAIRECMDAVIAAVPDCLDLIGGPDLELNPAKVKSYRPHKH